MQFENFKFWFLYESSENYTVIEKDTKSLVGFIDIDFNIPKFISASSEYNTSLSENEILEEWINYTKRPEYIVGKKVEIDGASFEYSKSSYVKLMTGIIMCRAYDNEKNPDEYSDYINKVINWIDSTDFYNSPASTIYHESFPHGLLYHTLQVYNCIIDLYQIPKFNGKIKVESASLCALVHDWCKIGLYESYKKNVKNDNTGQWERVDAYRRGSFPHAFGHGASSMYMAMKLFKLNEEEALAIRWHMGKWNVSENEVNELQQANEHYPLVHLLQFADQLSITEY